MYCLLKIICLLTDSNDCNHSVCPRLFDKYMSYTNVSGTLASFIGQTPVAEGRHPFREHAKTVAKGKQAVIHSVIFTVMAVNLHHKIKPQQRIRLGVGALYVVHDTISWWLATRSVRSVNGRINRIMRLLPYASVLPVSLAKTA